MSHYAEEISTPHCTRLVGVGWKLCLQQPRCRDIMHAVGARRSTNLISFVAERCERCDAAMVLLF